MKLKQGTKLQSGKYTIIRTCGQGGFGITYEGEQHMLGKVCIKEFFVKDFCSRNEETSDVFVDMKSKVDLVSDLEAKFYKEAQGLFRLHHNNIVRVIDVFKENNTAYFVMDYIDGKTIDQLIKESSEGRIPEEEALDYFKQIMQALDYIHSKNILHLDIKPDNILIERGRAVLIDFGVSKQYDEVGGHNTSELCGQTPGYSPIEQLDNTVNVFLPATDIYALGATYYKMVTGEKPPSAAVLLSRNGKIELPKYLSEVSKTIIRQCMKLRAEDRPQNIDEVLQILESRSFGKFFSGLSFMGRKHGTDTSSTDTSSTQDAQEEEDDCTHIVSNQPSILKKKADPIKSQPTNTVTETPTKKVTESTDTDSSDNKKKFIGIGVAAVIILGGIISFVISSNGGSSEASEAPAAPDTTVVVVDNTVAIDSLVRLADADATLDDDRECLLSAKKHYEEALALKPSETKAQEINQKLQSINGLLGN